MRTGAKAKVKSKKAKVKSKNEKHYLLPEEFGSLEEAGEFWGKHDSSDYEADMKEVHFEVDLKSNTHEVRVTNQLWREVRRIARQQGVAAETLVNLWLQEKIATTAKHS